MCVVGFECCRGSLKESLQMVSERFCMCTGSKCTNWKEIILAERKIQAGDMKVNLIQKWTYNQNFLFELSLICPSRAGCYASHYHLLFFLSKKKQKQKKKLSFVFVCVVSDFRALI